MKTQQKLKELKQKYVVKTYYLRYPYVSIERKLMFPSDFKEKVAIHPAAKGGRTVTKLFIKDGGRESKNLKLATINGKDAIFTAKCSPKDVFSRHIGLSISIGKAHKEVILAKLEQVKQNDN